MSGSLRHTWNDMANQRSNDEGLRELALFAGAGGGILAGQMLGWRTICAVEWESYPASVLASRQNDGHLEPFPIWDDVRTFDGNRWRGRVDVVSGGFPCQDISSAGRGAGIEGERSGMWVEMARIIGEVRPRFAFVENSPMLCSRGLGRVLGDLAALGFDAEWGVLGASTVGALHRRKRMWVVAHLNSLREPQPKGCRQNQRRRPRDTDNQNAHSLRPGLSAPRKEPERADGRQPGGGVAASDWWSAEPNVVRVVHGVPFRVDRIRSLGNAQVPQCAAAAFIEGCRRLMA